MHWWKMSLAGRFTIKQVKIVTRSDCRGCNPISGFNVRVGGALCATNVQIVEGGSKEVACSTPLTGNEVTIELQRKGLWVLTLCDVRVYGIAEDRGATTKVTASTSTVATTGTSIARLRSARPHVSGTGVSLGASGVARAKAYIWRSHLCLPGHCVGYPSSLSSSFPLSLLPWLPPRATASPDDLLSPNTIIVGSG